MENLISQVHSMDSQQLDQLVDAIRLRRQWLSKQAIRKMVVGERVSFDSGNRGIIRGVITKTNRKTVGVRSDCGTNWRVAASLIQLETA